MRTHPAEVLPARLSQDMEGRRGGPAPAGPPLTPGAQCLGLCAHQHGLSAHDMD